MKILICDDHPFIRESLRKALEYEFAGAEIYETNKGETALQILKTHKFDLVLMDIRLPGLGGINTLQKIHILYPDVKVIMVSQHDELRFMQQSLNYGAKGYFNKAQESHELITAVKLVMEGKLYYMDERMYGTTGKNVADNKDKPHDCLTAREYDVMIGLGEGKKQVAIADEQKLTAKTIFSHKERMMKKMGFMSGSDIIDYCRRYNLISDSNPYKS